jgi:hypothetical protein
MREPRSTARMVWSVTTKADQTQGDVLHRMRALWLRSAGHALGQWIVARTDIHAWRMRFDMTRKHIRMCRENDKVVVNGHRRAVRRNLVSVKKELAVAGVAHHDMSSAHGGQMEIQTHLGSC